MLKKCALLLFPEIRISFRGPHASATLNHKKVFFDYNCDKQDEQAFLMELVRLRQAYLKYSIAKPKLIVDITGAAGDKARLKESLEKAVHKFDHYIAGFVDGNKKMIL